MGWCRVASQSPNNQRIVAKGSANPRWAVHYPAGVTGEPLQFYMINAAGGTDVVTAHFPRDRWFLLVAQRGGGRNRLYLDGSLVADAASNNRDVGNAANMTIGSMGVTSYIIGGVCDEGLWIGRALSSAEIVGYYYDAVWPTGATFRHRCYENAGVNIADTAGAPGGPFHGVATVASWTTDTRCKARALAPARATA